MEIDQERRDHAIHRDVVDGGYVAEPSKLGVAPEQLERPVPERRRLWGAGRRGGGQAVAGTAAEA